MKRVEIYPTDYEKALCKQLKKQSLKSTVDPNKLSRVLVVKPWGYEHMFYQAEGKEADAWFIQFKPNETSSIHCHSEKISIIKVIEGEIIVHAHGRKDFYLKEGETVVFHPKVFHGESATKHGARLIQLERPSNKLDAFRYFDFARGRVKKPYNANCAMVWF